MGDVVDLRTTVGAVPIERDVVLVQGPEAIAFLQGQLSQDIEVLGIGASAWSLLLQPTGKVDAWLRATRTGNDEVALDVDAGHGDAVLARLQRFKLRTKAELARAQWAGWALRGPSVDEREAGGAGVVLPAAWPGIASVDLLGDDIAAPQGLEVLPISALEALRIEAGVPAMGAELTDSTIPAEAGEWLIDASVSFTKGCYTGQELVARIDSRGGNVPRPVRGLLVDGDPIGAGSTVHVGDKEVGTITSSAHSAALGAIALGPLGRAVEPGAQVTIHPVDGAETTAIVATLPLR